MKYILIIMLFVFTGCDKDPKPPCSSVVEHDVKYKFPPNSMMIVYVPPKPIAKARYIELTPLEKEKELTVYVVSLLSTVGKYKRQTESLRSWKHNQQKLIRNKKKNK